MSDYITLTDENFESDAMKSDLPVLVDLWAPWCGPCRAIAPAIEEIATEYKGQLKVGKLNVDENPKVAQMFGITSIPALLVIKDGKPVKGVIGVQTRDKIEEIFKPYLNGE